MIPVRNEVHDVLRRHQAFWQGAEVEKPSIGTSWIPARPFLLFEWGPPPTECILRPETLVGDHFLLRHEDQRNRRGCCGWGYALVSRPLSHSLARRH